MSQAAPVLIVGGGLAGVTLAWSLVQRGLPFLLVDRAEAVTSSKIAAGLVTPITGMRLNLSWRYPQLEAAARRLYQAVESKVGGHFYHQVDCLRLFRDAEQAALWRRRSAQPELAPFWQAEPDRACLRQHFHAPFGAVGIVGGAWLDTAAFLAASQRHFETMGCWLQGEVQSSSLVSSGALWRWQDREFAAVVWCVGWEAVKEESLAWLPFRLAQGSVLEIDAALGGESRVVTRGCWVAPGPNGRWRAGTTYDLAFAARGPHEPDPAVLEHLHARLRRTLLQQPYDLRGVQTAVRPAMEGSGMAIGRWPQRAGHFVFNGLGSKGVLRAPWAAEHLLEVMLHGQPLDPEVDLMRFA